MSGRFLHWIASRLGHWGRVLLVLILGIGVGLPGAARAQTADTSGTDAPRYTMALRDVPLDEALQQLVTRTGIDLAYSTALTRGKTVYCRARDATVKRLLSCLLAGTGVEYLRTSRGSYLLVEDPQAAPATGALAGRVVDAATGEPLPNANVLLADANAGTATNENGQFTVASVPAGMHRLAVTYVGYRTAVDSVQVPADGRDTIRVALSRRVVESPPVVIDGLQQRLPSAELGQAGLDASGLSQVTGSGTPDVLRSAGRQMGVALNRPLAEVTVQGGNSGEHVMQLDGVPVREPVALSGLLSAFSPKALDRLTIHKAGFGASEGSYTAGVLEATHDLDRAGSRYGAASIDPLSANGRVEQSWAGGAGQGQAMVAARTSLWGSYRSSSLHTLLDTRTALDRPFTPSWVGGTLDGGPTTTGAQTSHLRFQDVHGAVQQPITPFQQVSVSGYWGNTRLGTDVASLVGDGDDRRALLSQDRYTWTNGFLQARYDWLASSRTTGHLQVWGSRHDSHTFFGVRQDSIGTADPPGPPAADERILDRHSDEGNEISEGGAHAEVDVSLSSSTRLRAGVTPQFVRGTFRVRNPFLGILEHETRDWQVGSFAEAQVSPGLNLTATLGSRFTYVDARNQLYAEPRASLRYDRSDTALGGLAVRLAGGLYRQYVMQTEISNAGPTSVVPAVQFWLPIDASMAPARAYHSAASVLLTPTPDWSLRLETYYKWHPRTLQVDYAGLVQAPTPGQAPVRRTVDRQSDFMTAGQGRAFGAALHLRREGEYVTSSVSAEWSRTERRYPGRFDGRFVPAPWAQPLRLSATVGVPLGDHLEAQGHWKGTWGRPWALRRGYYDYLALAEDDPFPGYDLSRPGDQTLDAFSRLDLGVNGTYSVRGVSVEAQVRVVNVLDRHNPFDWSLSSRNASATPVPRTLPGRRAFVLIGIQY